MQREREREREFLLLFSVAVVKWLVLWALSHGDQFNLNG